MDLRKPAAWTLLRWTIVLKHWLHGVNGWPNLMTPAVARNPNSSNSRLRYAKAIDKRCRNDTHSLAHGFMTESLRNYILWAAHLAMRLPEQKASLRNWRRNCKKTAQHFTACCVVLWQHDAFYTLTSTFTAQCILQSHFYNSLLRRTFTARCVLHYDVLWQHNAFYNRTFTARCTCIT